jgi:hypothetical protein
MMAPALAATGTPDEGFHIRVDPRDNANFGRQGSVTDSTGWDGAIIQMGQDRIACTHRQMCSSS